MPTRIARSSPRGGLLTKTSIRLAAIGASLLLAAAFAGPAAATTESTVRCDPSGQCSGDPHQRRGAYVSPPGSHVAELGCRSIGHSVQGRPILTCELGWGLTRIAFLGGIHQGDEANTTRLVEMLYQRFAKSAAGIPQGVHLAFLPNVNPDGAYARSRLNARGVDLNRNWDADWRSDTYTSAGLLRGGGGPAPFSEPETQALRRYLVDNHFTAAIFFHSQAGLVVPRNGSRISAGLAAAVAAAAGYGYAPAWTAYPLSGQAVDYLDRLGIYAIDVELSTHTDPDFERNVRGLDAAIRFVLANPLIPTPFQTVSWPDQSHGRDSAGGPPLDQIASARS